MPGTSVITLVTKTNLVSRPKRIQELPRLIYPPAFRTLGQSLGAAFHQHPQQSKELGPRRHRGPDLGHLQGIMGRARSYHRALLSSLKYLSSILARSNPSLESQQ